VGAAAHLVRSWLEKEIESGRVDGRGRRVVRRLIADLESDKV
jgi:hypothetical protein